MRFRFMIGVAGVALAAGVSASPAVRAEAPIPVVATFSILGDMVARVGGDRVSVQTLVGPDGDTHVYQPTPADARAVSEARLLVVNGLDFEGWLDRLVKASSFRGTRVVATAGIEPLHGEDDEEHEGAERGAHHDRGDGHRDREHHDRKHDDEKDEHRADADHRHGAFDPHAWQDLRNALIYVDNIAAALTEADPANAAVYERNRAAYAAEIAALDADIRMRIAGLPADRRTIITSHDAFRYFGRAYGLAFLAPQGMSTEAEASARDVARLIERIRALRIPAVFVENVADARLLKRIADETGAVIGGTLYPGALSGPAGDAPTYLDMMRHNASALVVALSS